MGRSIEPVCSIECGSPVRHGLLDFRPRQSVYCRGCARHNCWRRYADRPIGPVWPVCPIVRSSPAHHLPHVNPNRGRSGGLKGLVHIYVKSICVLGTPPLSHQLPSQPGQSDQQTGDFAHFTQQRSYGRQFAYSSCSEPKMGRLCVYHDHLAAQSILVND